MKEKRENMKEVLLVIGNGFDLDLGLKTKYSDFANSEFWPEDSDSSLKNHLNLKKNLELWFDLEQELASYIKPSPPETEISKHIVNAIFSEDDIKQDIDYYSMLHEFLCNYLIEEQKTIAPNNNSAAAKILKVVGNASSSKYVSIYTFNYTELNLKARALKLSQINYTHMHGELVNNSIILGVNDGAEIKEGYEQFQKTMSPHYNSHNLLADLDTASEIIFFGLAMGEIDFTYFKSFFTKISNGEIVKPNDKKNVTIITKNESSRQKILMNLNQMGINKSSLFAQSNLNFIKTEELISASQTDKLCADVVSVLKPLFRYS